MRSRKALKNSLLGICYEAVALACGFIVPRLILGSFGSGYNGITNSVTQFLSCIVLFKTSITGVSRAALFKPLAEKDDYKISSIINATETFMRKIAIIFGFSVIVFALLYSFFMKEEFDCLFSSTLVIILGISTFVQYYFGVTYQILLEADQKQSVIYFVQIVTTILNTLIAALLIKLGATIHIVKLGSALAFSFNPIIINLYVRKHYKLKKDVPSDNTAIKQRWDAFGQSAAAFVHNNTDMVVLTLFSNIYEVSVYSVYYIVCNGLKTLLKTFTSSVGAAFGNMMAKGENDVIQKNMDIFEYVGIIFTTIIFTIAGIMMLPFVSVYTHGVTDAEYIRPWFSLLMVVGMAFFCYRIPYQSVIEAAGHYKQTRNGAILEAIVNILVSVITVINYGLIGVAIGTLIANLIRTINYVGYCNKHLLHRSIWNFIKHMLTSLVIVVLTVAISYFIGIINATNYITFAINTALCGIICVSISLIISLLFYRTIFVSFIKMIKRSIKIKSQR